MSSRRQVMLERGWLLHHFPYRDSSLIIEAFTRERGRFGLVARGARRARSQHRAILQSFTPLQLSYTGTGELATLTGVEPDGPPLMLAGTALMAGYYVNELLLRLLARSDEHAVLFDNYTGLLRSLAGGEDIALSLRGFERQLLDELGYGLNLDHDIVDGAALDPAAHYEYVLEQGPRRVSLHNTHGRLCFSGQTLIDIRELQLRDPGTRAAARRLFTVALDLYLGHQPLKSRQVLEGVLRLARETPDVSGDGKER